jgi:hypothetical protein
MEGCQGWWKALVQLLLLSVLALQLVCLHCSCYRLQGLAELELVLFMGVLWGAALWLLWYLLCTAELVQVLFMLLFYRWSVKCYPELFWLLPVLLLWDSCFYYTRGLSSVVLSYSELRWLQLLPASTSAIVFSVVLCCLLCKTLKFGYSHRTGVVCDTLFEL